MMNFSYFSNPLRFIKLCKKLFPFLLTLMVITLGTGLYYALFASPPDYQQKDSVRIMYVHVPAAWLSLMIYFMMAICAFIALVWKHILADLIAKSIAPAGLMFTTICLITGSIWGKPMWGTWWAWDARITSVLILFFLYLGYIALSKAYTHPTQGMKAANLLAIFGSLNLPIIKFSVEWWNSVHQPASIMKLSGPSIHSSMLLPLFLMFAGFFCYFLLTSIVKVESEIMRCKILNFNNLEGQKNV